MKIAVLGSGLSGLLAGKALKNLGHNDITFLSKDTEKPEPKGFIILHDNCDMDLEKCHFPVIQEGSEKVYSKKLGYGDKITSSWKKGTKKYWMVGYNPYQAIHILHNEFKDRIFKTTVTRNNIGEIKKDYDKIISTIPPSCTMDVELEYKTIWVEELESTPRYCFDKPCVIYNGNDGHKMTRETIGLWGRYFNEYYRPVKGAEMVKKVKGYHQPKEEGIHFTGRYGKWNKNVLAHQVYYEILGGRKWI